MRTCCKIELNPKISVRNYVGCLVHYFMLSFVFVSVDSLQPYLFQKQYQIARKDQVENFKNVLAIFFDIAVKLACAPVFGHLCDRLGRKTINLYGIVCIAISMFLMPYVGSFEWYILLRCLYATGAIAISVVPLLADYVSHSSRGTCAAFLVLMSSLGALASAEINFSILNNLSSDQKIYVQYGSISAIILVLGLFYTLFCIKPGSDYYARGNDPRRNVGELLRVARESMKSPEITNGYTSAFLARGDSILLSLNLVLWAYSFESPSDRSDQSYEDAFSKSSMLSGITYLVIMFTCIIYGRLYERRDFSRSKLMIVMLSVAALGALLINFASSPSSYMAYVALVVLGVGMSGLLTASLYLVNQYSTPESRGFITGLQTAFGVVGILLQTLIGAILYEWVDRCGPFDYFAATCLLVLGTTVWKYKSRKQELVNLPVEGSLIQEEGPEPSQ